MNSIFSKRLKLTVITLTFLVSFFIVFVWLVGPVQAIKAKDQALLNNIYAHTAFDECEIVKYTQVGEPINLAQCYVKDTHVVWILVDEKGSVLERTNWDRTNFLDTVDYLKRSYQSSEVSFSYYQNAFVFNVKTNEAEYFINKTDLTKVLSIMK